MAMRRAMPVLRDPGWGLPYGGRPARTGGGSLVWLWRKGQTCRWYNARGRRVGPGQANVAPAIAYALTHGWDLDADGPNAMDYFDVPPGDGLSTAQRLARSGIRRGRK